MIDDDNNQDVCSPERHVFMAIINEQYANELPDQISANELMTNTLQDENDARMAAQRARNAKRVERSGITHVQLSHGEHRGGHITPPAGSSSLETRRPSEQFCSPGRL